MKKLFILLLFFAAKISFAAGPDSLDINDPKNWNPDDPNCPCHKLQQQAEEQWKKLHPDSTQEQNNVAPNNNDFPNDSVQTNPSQPQNGSDSSNVNHTNTNTGTAGTSSGGDARHVISSTYRWKKMKNTFWKIRKRMRNKHSGTKRGNFRLADCFEF